MSRGVPTKNDISLISSRPGRWEGESGAGGQPVIVYQWTHLGLVADCRDGGSLYADVVARGRVGTHCDTSQHPVMTVKRRTRDDGHVLTVTREAPVVVGHVVARPVVTRLFLAPGEGTDPSELPHIWREALTLWLVLETARDTATRMAAPNRIDQRWRALLEIDWNTAPGDEGAPPAVEAPHHCESEAVA